MEPTQNEKKTKSPLKPSNSAALRVKKETRKRVLAEIQKANKKEYGKRIRVDQIVALAMSLIRPEHIQRLQENSLSHADRLDRDYRAYVAKHGPISKDDYLGKRLTGDVATQSTSNDVQFEAKNSG